MLVRTLRRHLSRRLSFVGKLVLIKTGGRQNHYSQVKPDGLLLAQVILLMMPDVIAVPMPSSTGVVMHRSPVSVIATLLQPLPRN